MSNSKWILLILLCLFVSNVDAFRIPRPNTFFLPWDGDQMKQHNEAHEDLWNLSNGEFNLDIVTSAKTGADNGDIWLITTGLVTRIQYKAQGRVFTAQEESD